MTRSMLVHYSLDVQPGQMIAIEAMTTAEPLIRDLHTAILRAYGFPVLALTMPGLSDEFFALAAEAQLDVREPGTRFILEHADGRVQVMSATESSELPADPARVARWSRAQQPLMERFLVRLGAGDLRYVAALYPSAPVARDAGMALDAFVDLVARAALLDRPDPVAAWRKQSARQQRLIDWLGGGREAVHILANGTDLRLSIQGRRVCNADSHLNMPDGEIYTSPVEDSVEGTITFAGGVRLRFQRGRVVEAHGSGIHNVLAVDDGAHRVGEFAFGTNSGLTQLTGNTALDEKLGGTVHLALGASLPGTGGSNCSATHRDLVCDRRRGGEVTVDRAVFLRDGQFQVS